MMFLGSLGPSRKLPLGVVAVLLSGATGAVTSASAATKRGSYELSGNAITALTVAQDDASILTQFPALIAELQGYDGTEGDKRTHIRETLGFAQTIKTALTKIPKITTPQDADPALAKKIRLAQQSLAQAITDFKTQVLKDELASDTVKVAQKLSTSAQKLEDIIDQGFATLPKKQRPNTLSLTLPTDQNRLLNSNNTVHWVFNGPASALVSGGATWSQDFGNISLPLPATDGQPPPRPSPPEVPSPYAPLYYKYTVDSSTSGTPTHAKMHTTATAYSGWVYLSVQVGNRRRGVLLLNLGTLPPPAHDVGPPIGGGGGVIITEDWIPN